MEIYIIIMLFIYGTVFGSFYGVVGERLSNGKSIIKPPSSCDVCGKKLRWYELIPIASFVMQKGRCQTCKNKLSIFYPFIEILTGILFVISYLFFGFSSFFFISLLISSYFVIVIVSDLKYYVIEDSVTFFFVIVLSLLNFLIFGFDKGIHMLFNGLLLFFVMYLIMIVGSFIFKKECLGGGDVKLMFFIGLFLPFYNGLFSIFLSSFLALPFSIFVLLKKKSSMIPFGPFLLFSALFIYLTSFDIVEFLKNIYGI